MGKSMKLKQAIKQADKVFVNVIAAGEALPVQVSKISAVAGLGQWIELSEDFEGDNTFVDDEGATGAWSDEERKHLYLGN